MMQLRCQEFMVEVTRPLSFEADGSLTVMNLQNNHTIRFSLAQTLKPDMIHFSSVHKGCSLTFISD